MYEKPKKPPVTLTDPSQSCVGSDSDKRLYNKSNQGDVPSEWSQQWSIDCKFWPTITEQTGPDSRVVITAPLAEGHSAGKVSNIHILPTLQFKKIKVQPQWNIRDSQHYREIINLDVGQRVWEVISKYTLSAFSNKCIIHIFTHILFSHLQSLADTELNGGHMFCQF